ncbi:MAG TPA: hypothetical protein PLY87_07325, partial [Planctomycetaceae bacterium]|nr:hypothetical protein [Planctomycetaceae bacterium]
GGRSLRGSVFRGWSLGTSLIILFESRHQYWIQTHNPAWHRCSDEFPVASASCPLVTAVIDKRDY